MAKANSASKRLAEAMREANTIRAYVQAMAAKGVTVTEVEWGPADPMRRNSKNTKVVKV
jgi:hypothetical protein